MLTWLLSVEVVASVFLQHLSWLTAKTNLSAPESCSSDPIWTFFIFQKHNVQPRCMCVCGWPCSWPLVKHVSRWPLTVYLTENQYACNKISCCMCQKHIRKVVPPLLPQSPPKRIEMHRTFLCQLTVRSLLPCIQFSRNVQSLRIELFTLKPWTGFVRLKYLFSTGEMFDFLTDAEWDDWRFFFFF